MTKSELFKIAKPILFNTEMVKAILAGRKTVTRRVAKTMRKNSGTSEFYTPIMVNDILYVRETWCDDRQFTHDDIAGQYFYKADFPIAGYSDEKEFKWKPSIHMPKETARIFLKVKDVRVERLQDIAIDGIRNEGLSSMAAHVGDVEIALKEWEILWNSTVKKSDLDLYGWDANPWVWVIEFERVEPDSEV